MIQIIKDTYIHTYIHECEQKFRIVKCVHLEVFTHRFNV